MVSLEHVPMALKFLSRNELKKPNHEEKLKELGELDSWKRAEFIEKGGWDKMPGQEKADYAVSRACADGLELLIKK